MRKFFSVMRNPKINVAATAVCFSALSALLLATSGMDIVADTGMKIKELSANVSADYKKYEGTDENANRLDRYLSEKTDENVPWLEGGYVTEEDEKKRRVSDSREVFKRCGLHGSRRRYICHKRT